MVAENEGVETSSEPTPRPHRRLALASQIVFFAPLAILLISGVIASFDDSLGMPALWLVFLIGVFILVPLAWFGLGSWVGVAIGRSRLKKGKKFWPAYLITLIASFVLLVLLYGYLSIYGFYG